MPRIPSGKGRYAVSIVTLKNEELTVKISTLGAEIQSIEDKNGVERLWQGDPAIWKGRAPILFPVAGGSPLFP